jgi:VanZ family protein
MPMRLRKKTAGVISFLIYLGIFLVSSLPGSALPKKIPDIIPHFCEYAVLAFFLVQVFGAAPNRKTTAIVFLALLPLVFFDEVHQAFVPGRFCSLKDMAADMAGGAGGLLAYHWQWRWAGKKRCSG